MKIRGFGYVKDRAIKEVKVEEVQLLEKFRKPMILPIQSVK
jgi:hypothetical protein